MDQVDIGYLLNKATRNFRLRLGDSLTETGLRPQQAAALMAISRSPGEHLTPGALAHAIETDAATTSGLIERLTRDGWIDSVSNPEDGRSRLVGLTIKAQKILPAVLVAANAVSSEATSRLTLDEVETLRNLLYRLWPEEDINAFTRKAGPR